MEQNNVQTIELDLPGAEKAAALLLAMGKDSALKLAGFFSRQEIEMITDAANRLSAVDVSVIESLTQEFGKEYTGYGMFSDPDGLTDFFESFSGQQGGAEDGEVAEKKTSAPISDANMPEFEHIKEFIATEPVLIGSVLLGVLSDEMAADILASLEPDFRKKLFKAFLDRKILPDELQVRFKAQLFDLIIDQNTEEGPSETVDGAARIINYFSEQIGDDLVGFIEVEAPEIAAVIKKSLFKFTAIVTLAKADRSILFDGVESDDVVKALGAADDALKESILETLSQRNRRMVEAELARAQTSEEDIAASQRKIAGLALALSKEDKITLPDSEET